MVEDKPIAFRPSDKALAILKDYMKTNNLKSKSQAVNDIIEQHQKVEFSEEVTGVLIHCRLRPYWVDAPVLPFIELALVDTSVCKSCPRYPCEAWKMSESWERVTSS